MAEQIEILVVDDDKKLPESCKSICQGTGYRSIKRTMRWMVWRCCRNMILNWRSLMSLMPQIGPGIGSSHRIRMPEYSGV